MLPLALTIDRPVEGGLTVGGDRRRAVTAVDLVDWTVVALYPGALAVVLTRMPLPMSALVSR